MPIRPLAITTMLLASVAVASPPPAAPASQADSAPPGPQGARLAEPVMSVRFSADGSRVVAWSAGEAIVVDAATGALVGRLAWPPLDAASLSPDGARLDVAQADGSVFAVKVAPVMTPPKARRLPAVDPEDRVDLGWPEPIVYIESSAAKAMVVQNPWALPPGKGFVKRDLRATPTGFIRATGGRNGVEVELFDAGRRRRKRTVVDYTRLRETCSPDHPQQSLLAYGVSLDGQHLSVLLGGSRFEDGEIPPSLCTVQVAPRLTRVSLASLGADLEPFSYDDPGLGLLRLEGSTPSGCILESPHGVGPRTRRRGSLSSVGAVIGGRPDLGREARCGITGGGPSGPVTLTLLTQEGALTLVRDGWERAIKSDTPVRAAALHQSRLAIGLEDGRVELRTLAEAPPKAAPASAAPPSAAP